jgi:membrane protein DedA with SNARE-associated domain
MARADFKQFALYAYTGAFLWVATFLSLGYFFGEYCFSIFKNIEIGFDKIVLLAALIFVGYLIFLFRKNFRR